MIATDLAPAPTRQQLAAIERTAKGKVTGRLKRAVDAMVWLGKPRKDAAEHAKLTEHALYCAFRRPHVKAYYLAELDVLRTSERARSIHRLCQIREAADNMPAVNAIRELMQTPSEHSAPGGFASSPGLVVIIEAPGASVRTIEHVQQACKDENV